MKTLLKLVLLILALALIFKAVDLREVSALLLGLKPAWVVVLLALSFLMVGVSVVKWRLFFRGFGGSASLSRLFGLYLIGYFVNLLLPSAIGGDVVRSLYLGGRDDRTSAISATILERYTGVIAMVTLACIASLVITDIPKHIQVAVFLTAACLVGLSTILLSPLPLRCIAMLPLPTKWQRTITAIHGAFREGHSISTDLLLALLLSLCFHLLTIVNTLAAAYAIGWDSASFLQLSAVIPLVLLIGAIPLTPQGLGIQEGAFVYFLHAVGATTPQALAVALLLRLKTYVLALCGGGVLMLMRRERGANVWENHL